MVNKRMLTVRRLTTDALLTCIALAIYVVELALPPISPVPGVKPGLSNIITTWAMFTQTPIDAGMILLSRIILGAIYSGNISAILYSAAGGAACFILSLLLRRVLSHKQIWVAGVLCAVVHNIAQIGVAILITKTPKLLMYLPVLMVSGIIAGLFTGLCTQLVANRIEISKPE